MIQRMFRLMSNLPSYLDFPSTPQNFFVYTSGVNGDLYKNERDLFSSFTCEAFNLRGVKLKYYVVDFNTSADKLFGEDNNRSVLRSFDFMGRYSLDQAAESKLWTAFGIQGLDDITCLVSKKHFDQVSRYNMDKEDPIIYEPHTPRIGDFVRADYNSFMYEITDVKEETGLFMQSKQHVWSLTLKAWRNEHLDVSTSTSADMPELTTLIDTDDPFDVKGFVTSASPSIEYTPSPVEKPSDEFWS